MKPQMKSSLVLALALAMLTAAGTAAVAQSWTTAQPLNITCGEEVKECQLWPATGGGFHATYHRKGSPNYIYYRKFQNGYLSQQSTVFGASFDANPSVCESYDGKIYVAYEDWSYDPTVSIGMAVTTDGGNTWQRQTVSPPHYTKLPVVLPYGGGSKLMMTYAAPTSHNIRYALFDGASWQPEQLVPNAYLDNEWRCGWACTSPKDGSIWRLWGDYQGGSYYWFIERWNGTAWESPIRVNSPLPSGYPARPGIAANSAGHVAVTWDENSAFWMRVYDPNTAIWRPQILVADKGNLYGGPNITSIPGSLDFYVAYDGYGKRYYAASNSCGAQEDLVVGMSHGFTPDTAVCAGADGTIYAAFENWNSGTAQWFYTVKPATAPGPTGTVAGRVTDQYGVAVPGATVGSGILSALTNASGDYTLTNVPVGSQTISANKQFYTGQTISGVQVNQGQTTPLNLTIQAVPPAPVTGFRAVASDSTVRLYWTNPASANYAATVVVCKTAGFPTGPADGTVVCVRSTTAGTPDSFVHSGLPNNVTRYYAAFARDSESHYSAGVSTSAEPHSMTCLEAKMLDAGLDIDLKGKVVTAIFSADACIYIADADRSAGIRVAGSGAGLAVGDVVDVSGKMADRVLSGVVAERTISPATVTRISAGSIRPVAMTCRSVGGASVGSKVSGVKNGLGLNNMGSLVRICGKVTYKAGSYLFVDDGSRIANLYGLSTPEVGVMVRCPGTPSVNVGDVVAVTGIVEGSVPSGWTLNRSYLHMRDWNDLN